MLVEDLRRKNTLSHNFSWIDEIRFKLVIRYVKKICYKVASKGYTECSFYIPHNLVPDNHTSLFCGQAVGLVQEAGTSWKSKSHYYWHNRMQPILG